ncbi:MAG: M23 family metallopeptidase [Treponema sp.]|nr:M23 family metallopeptidase [Treponema sp.]
MFIKKAGKGVTLAFFLILTALPVCQAQQTSAFPEIQRFTPSDTVFRQLASDIEANRMRLARIRNNLATSSSQNIAEHLTIYQYTTRPGEDIFFLAARTNIPYSTLASLNRISNPTSLETGSVLLIPSCPGIFIPLDIETDLEKIIGAARQNSQDFIRLTVRKSGSPVVYHFFPGAEFSPTERAFFLNSGFRFPLRNYRVSSSFGMRNDPFFGHLTMHNGIDLAAPEGTEVFAAADGIVTASGFDPVYGNYIIITHSNRWTSLYGHLQVILVALRTEVKSGNLIGRVGSTGQSTGPHLHFELRQDGRAFDPAGRLRP